MGNNKEPSDTLVDPFLDNCRRYQLSPREIEIVLLIRKGLTYHAIAELLHISDSTVDTHMQNIYTKVGERGKIALLKKLEH